MKAYEADCGSAALELVPDASYGPALLRLIRTAKRRVWASMFMVETNPDIDLNNRVPELLRELAQAHWRGIDVLLLLGGSRSNLEIAEHVAAATLIARHLGLPVRTLGSPELRGSHTKAVVADDSVLTGSHNWTTGALSVHTQDSVLVHSPALAAFVSHLILTQWRRAKTA